MINLIIVVTEDDRTGDSYFFLDLPNLIHIATLKNITCNVLYHSLKNHGNYWFRFGENKYSITPIEPLDTTNDSRYLEVVAQFIKKTFDPNATNGFIYSSHCWHVFIRPFRRNVHPGPILQLLETHQMHFKFMIFDCCNMSCIENVYLYRNVTEYLVGCEYASPLLGFLSPQLGDILIRTDTWPTRLKNICRAFLERVEQHKPNHEIKETDAVVLTTQFALAIPQLFHNVVFIRNQKARTQNTPKETTIFDLITLLKYNAQITHRKSIENWARKTILFYAQSHKLHRPHLHGISIVLNWQASD